jgi:hypothetical protein
VEAVVGLDAEAELLVEAEAAPAGLGVTNLDEGTDEGTMGMAATWLVESLDGAAGDASLE